MEAVHFPEPRISHVLFSHTRFSWVWLSIRAYVGYEWLMAGWEKAVGGWLGSGAGSAIGGFFTGVLQKTGGAHPTVSPWYAYFIGNIAVPHPVLFSYLITLGELAVGAGIILGAFTGIAAFFGVFMNLNFIFAGAISVNPVLALLEMFLILAWRNAGWWGLDRFLLPRLGVPWKRWDPSLESAAK